MFMKEINILDSALSSLSDTERQLLSLLKTQTTKNEVISFINNYHIEDEPSVSTFLLNELMDKYQIQRAEVLESPRIRGLVAFFRFQNVTAIMQYPDEKILDADMALKIKYPDVIRPFSAKKGFLDQRLLRNLAGKRYTKTVLNRLVPTKLQNKVYLISTDDVLLDLIYLEIYRSLQNGQNKDSIILHIYDLHRYYTDRKPSVALRLSLIKMRLRHFLGRIKRWALK